MKTHKIQILCALLIAAILFLPIPKGTLNDGGTRIYAALTYKLVIWNRINLSLDENGNVVDHDAHYHRIRVYWLPHNLKSIDLLWKAEISRS